MRAAQRGPTAGRRSRFVPTEGLALRRESLSRLELLRVLLYALLGTAALVPGWGVELYVLTVVVVGCSVLIQALAHSRFVSAIAAFELGFVAVIAVEGIFQSEELQRWDPALYQRTSGFLVAAFSLAVIGHQLVFRGVEPARDLWTSRYTVDRGRSVAAIAVLAGTYVLGIWPKLMSRVTSGRGVDVADWFAGSPVQPLTSGIINGAGMILPALIAFHVLRVERRGMGRALLLSAPVFLIQFVIGTRFPLLYAAVGLIVVRTAPHRLRPFVIVRSLAVALLLVVLSTAMQQFRAVGITNVDSNQVLAVDATEVTEGEGAVRSLMQIIDYVDGAGYTNGTSTATIVVFWVPRSIWPDKPEQLSYWFPRRYGESTGFSEGHSIASTFAGEPYADFGYVGALLGCVGLGMALGLGDRWISQQLALRDAPSVAVVGPLYGAYFFAARSIQTAFVAGSAVLFLGWVYVRYIRPAPRDEPGRDDEPRSLSTPMPPAGSSGLR